MGFVGIIGRAAGGSFRAAIIGDVALTGDYLKDFLKELAAPVNPNEIIKKEDFTIPYGQTREEDENHSKEDFKKN